MHPNAQVVEKLYSSLSRHAPGAMAECYDPAATFRDIAFDLKGKEQIASMWEMICSTDIRTSFEVLDANSTTAMAKAIDEYTFSETGRPVRNVIESRFRFRDGLIDEHVDSCDPRLWGAMALGGVRGFVAGRVGFIRRYSAARLLRRYRAKHQA